MNYYLGKNSRSLRRHDDGAPLTRTPPRQSLGAAGRHPLSSIYAPLGVAANTGPLVDVSFTARALCSADGSSPWS